MHWVSLAGNDRFRHGIAVLTHHAISPFFSTPARFTAHTRSTFRPPILKIYKNKAKNLLITVEALRDNPVHARARLLHEQELQHTEKVITTIKEEGFWDGRIHNG